MGEILQKLGLTAYEEKIYLTLLEYGSLGAKEISDCSNVPKTAVYPNLKNLELKGLITSFKGDKMLFEIVDPKIGLNSYVKQKQKEIEGQATLAIDLAQERYHKKKIIKHKEVISLSVGKISSSMIYNEMLNSAKNKVYIIGWRAYTIGNKFSFIPELKKLIQKGIDVRLLVTGDSQKKQWNLLKAYKNAGIKVRFTPVDNFSIVIVDGEECKITLKDRKLPQKFNMQVRDISLAKAMESYFLSVWNTAERLNFDNNKSFKM